MDVRDRVKELRRVKARELQPNSKNWRKHPQAQWNALKGVLEEIGFADALIARETPDGLVLIDGHLRADMNPDMELPVLIVDLDEAEADKLLLTLDPLAAMAQSDQDSLLSLLESTKFNDQAIKDMLEALANGETQPLLDPMKEWEGMPEFLQEDKTAEFYAKEGTLPKSLMLSQVHPDVARISYRFHRVHHYVNYRRFKKTRLIPKEDMIISEGINEYGMTLQRIAPTKRR